MISAKGRAGETAGVTAIAEKKIKLNVLVATREKQGQRSNDFFWAKESELVMFGLECDGEVVDGKCGCRRTASGFETHKATTTFKVEEREMTREEYIKAFNKSQADGGWPTQRDEKTDWPKLNEEECDALLKMAAKFPVGSVLEKRGRVVQMRV